MAELVEQRACVVEAQKAGLAAAPLGEVRHIDDQRADVAFELLLVAQRGHPGAAVLGGAREVVAEEQAAVAAFGVADLPGLDVGMPARNVAAALERKPEQLVGGIERGLDDVVKLEVGLELALVDIALALAQL